MNSKINSEIIIIGAGLSGLLCANILAKSGINVIIIEQSDLKSKLKINSDGRVLAISNSNAYYLKEQNLWQILKENFCPIEQIRIADEYSPFFLHFDNKLVQNQDLGYMVDAHFLYKSLYECAESDPNIILYENTIYQKIEEANNYTRIYLANGDTISTNLIIAADGKESLIREGLKLGTFSWDYNQTAMVVNIDHELPHNNVAVELFLPSGPFAVLPIKGGFKSAIVWSEKSNLANIFKKMDSERIGLEIAKRMDHYLGDIKLSGKLFSYPLSVKMCKKYYKNRVCLIGDAAHFIHPVAGQGFNQAIRDINSLTKLIIEHKNLGLDVGSQILLEQYQNDRKIDNYSMLAFTDLSVRIFSNKIQPLRSLRKLALGIGNNITILQQKMMEYAMGKR